MPMPLPILGDDVGCDFATTAEKSVGELDLAHVGEDESIAPELATVGCSDGPSDGTCITVGAVVGLKLGNTLGLKLGNKLGDFVGLALRSVEGE